VKDHNVLLVGHDPRGGITARGMNHGKRRAVVVGEGVARDAPVEVTVVIPTCGHATSAVGPELIIGR
jgi:hypothetical protein